MKTRKIGEIQLSGEWVLADPYRSPKTPDANQGLAGLLQEVRLHERELSPAEGVWEVSVREVPCGPWGVMEVGFHAALKGSVPVWAGIGHFNTASGYAVLIRKDDLHDAKMRRKWQQRVANLSELGVWSDVTKDIAHTMMTVFNSEYPLTVEKDAEGRTVGFCLGLYEERRPIAKKRYADALPEDCEMFSVQRGEIRIESILWHAEDGWKLTQFKRAEDTLEEFVRGMKETEDNIYYDEIEAATDQYEHDLTDTMARDLFERFGGDDAVLLQFDEVTENTPDGWYVHING